MVRCLTAADLRMRNLDRSMIEGQKKRALCHGRTAEARHRAILDPALARTRRRLTKERLWL